MKPSRSGRQFSLRNTLSKKIYAEDSFFRARNSKQKRLNFVALSLLEMEFSSDGRTGKYTLEVTLLREIYFIHCKNVFVSLIFSSEPLFEETL